MIIDELKFFARDGSSVVTVRAAHAGDAEGIAQVFLESAELTPPSIPNATRSRRLTRFQRAIDANPSLAAPPKETAYARC